MGDEFHIPPATRREPNRFEPPPWERDAFEEISKRRDAEQADEELTEAAEVLLGEEKPAEAVPAPVAPAPQAQVPAVDEARVQAMLAQLAATERTSGKTVLRVSMGSAAVVGLVGLLLVAWGVAAIAGSSKSGQVGTIGGAVLLLFGALFFGVAVWIVVRTLRQRGVL